MKQPGRTLPLVLGVILILAALSLLLVMQFRAESGLRHSKQVAEALNAMLPERTAGIPQETAEDTMPVLEYDGEDYAALLEIPVYGLTLPVLNQWDSRNLYAAPRRFGGNAAAGTLVIGGADHPGQFAFCSSIEPGMTVTVTDMTGAQFSCRVSRVDRADHAESAWLMQPEFDLTLFCRDRDSMEYIAVRCELAIQ